MNHASLFSGIGGFDLAAEWAGWNNVFNCEIDKFCQRVLKYHFPNALQFGDIKQLKFKRDEQGQLWVMANTESERLERENKSGNKERGVREHLWGHTARFRKQIKYIEEEPHWLPIPSIDIITGGFPCQPFSMAGKRRGTDDDRHLWPEMLRTITEIAPRWVVGENVFGFTNWNGGMVFNQVLSDLENQGYEVQPFIIPACSVNAPHRRDRVWIVAHAKQNGSRTGRVQFAEGQQLGGRGAAWGESASPGEYGSAADTDCTGSQTERELSKPSREKRISDNIPGWHDFPTQPPLRSRNDGFPGGLDGITVSRLRNESIKAAGNAIVPQVAYEIFKAINQYESMQP